MTLGRLLLAAAIGCVLWVLMIYAFIGVAGQVAP